jgi:hypothetical protein
MLIWFDSAVLPLQWAEDWNTWVHLTLGSITVKAKFWQQTRFRRVEKGFQATNWAQPFASTLTIQNPASFASRFEAAPAF